MPLRHEGMRCIQQGGEERSGRAVSPVRLQRDGARHRPPGVGGGHTAPLLTLAFFYGSAGLAGAAGLPAAPASASAPAPAPAPVIGVRVGLAGTQATPPIAADRCIAPASAFHGVHPGVLRAILRVESGLNPGALGRNRNGSVDIGIGQINSIHFRELARHGISPRHLLDACVGTYVAAWHLRRQIERHGNTWFGIAAYHSLTPKHNLRYQLLLYGELTRPRR